MSKVKNNDSKEEKFIIFAIITFIIAIVSLIVMYRIEDILNSGRAFRGTQNIPFYSMFLGIASALGLAISIILKNKYSILCMCQGLFLAVSMYLFKHFAIESSIRIAGKGVAGYFYYLVQAIIVIYIIVVIVYPNFAKNKKR